MFRLRSGPDFLKPIRPEAAQVLLLVSPSAPRENLAALGSIAALAHGNGLAVAIGHPLDAAATARELAGRAPGARLVASDSIDLWEARELAPAVRGGSLRHWLLAGGPAETVLLRSALGLLGQFVDVAVVWDASFGLTAAGLDLAQARATQAGVQPYSFAALAAELDGRIEPEVAARPQPALAVGAR